MKPAEILTIHRARVQELYTETGSWAKVYEMLSKSLPEIAGMSQATFKQYAPILIELNKQLNKQGLNTGLNNSAELNTVKHELEQVKQELSILQELNTELNKELELNNSVKHELNEVKQQLNNQIRLNSELNKEQGLNMPVKQETVKQKLNNIAGWNIQESGGYFRAFKKMGGKMKAVYLGKNLDDAETKIQAKERQLKA
jgi:predicted nuclease with TOPRIM domain